MSNTNGTPRMQIAIDGKILSQDQSKHLVAALIVGLELYIDKFEHVTSETGKELMARQFPYLFSEGAKPMSAFEADETRSLLMEELRG